MENLETLLDGYPPSKREQEEETDNEFIKFTERIAGNED